MVGQALQRGKYRYYRCRRSYAGFSDDRCDSRYVQAKKLEPAVLAQLGRVLSDPTIVIAEARHLNESSDDPSRRAEVATRLDAVEAQQRRLTRLYTAGDLPDDVLNHESLRLRQERDRLERELGKLSALDSQQIDIEALERNLPGVLERVRNWIHNAGQDDMALMLQALQVQARASRDEIHIEGVVPTSIPENGASTTQDLVTIARTSG